MTRSSLSVRSQAFTRNQFAVITVLLLIGLGVASTVFAQQPTPASGPKIWLQERQLLPMQGTAATLRAPGISEGLLAQPVAMASRDLDGDGIADLVVGYSTGAAGYVSIQKGNLDAFAPQNDASFQAIGRGEFPAPFLPQTRTVAVPVRPDFVALGNFSGSGHTDLVVAARGGSSAYLLAGDGRGGFGAPATLAFTGSVTALASGRLGRSEQFTQLIVGLSGPGKSFSLMAYSGTDQGLAPLARFSLSAPASNINFGEFGDGSSDVAFLAGGQVFIVRSSTMQLVKAPLPVTATALALGSFIYDRNGGSQMALLGSDGSVQIAVRNEFDPRAYTVEEFGTIRRATLRNEPVPFVPARSFPANGWKIVESFPAVGTVAQGQQPAFFRTRISSNGADDVMWLGAAGGQMVVISHADLEPGASTFVPGQVSVKPYSGSPLTALPVRINVDGRPGVMAVHQGETAPSMLMPLPDPTFTVNTTADTVDANIGDGICADSNGQCSLRAAVQEANATPGTDTIMVPAGTFILTRPKVAGVFNASTGALYINDSVNITGAGQNLTIIQAGTNTSNGVDMVMAVNEDINPITNATANISSLTLKFGHNNGTHGNDGDGGCMEFDNGGNGTAQLTLTNVTLDSCSTTKGEGGGIAIFNFFNTGNGDVTITNSIIQNNSAVDSTSGVAATGGGIWIAVGARMTMTNTQVINNNATQVAGTVAGEGGGITITSQLPGSRQTVIHGGSISGNHAAGNGGGIHNVANLLIDQGTIISNNTAGTANLTNAQDGGGIWTNTLSNGCPGACTDSVTLQHVTITGNSTTLNGGGIASGNNTGAGNVTMNFSRLAGNSAPNGNNLSNNHSTVLATNNWWGVNTPTSTIHDTGTTTTSTPFIKLTHTANPAVIRINQSTTLTGDMSKDNNGSGAALAGNLDRIVGLPITFDTPVLGSIPDAQPETLNANAQATATFNAGGTSGLGHANATVDQAVVTADIVILEPLKITKSFVPAVVAVNAPSTLTLNPNNPNVIAVDASFTDTLPAGLLVATPPAVTNTCGGTVTAVAGSGSVSFSNASLAVGTCTITVHVSSAVDSVYSNSVTINSTAAGTGAQSTSSASLTVINPPQSTKTFNPISIPLNTTSSLSIALQSTNQNLTLANVSFTDTLPLGLVVATPSNLTNSCGGTATATAGSSSVSLSGVTLAHNATCTLSVDVLGNTAGQKSNSVTASDTTAGAGNTSTATLTVVSPPVISKTFGAVSIPLNGSTSLSFTIQNNNTGTTLTGVAFSDTFPTGLVIATPNGLTGSCGGGAITAVANSGVVSLSVGSIPAMSSCTFSINVTGTSAGLKQNSTGPVSSTEGGSGAAATADLKVEAPPSISKSFNPSTITEGGTTSLTFTITNPTGNVDPLTGVAFTDTLPTGLTVANATATVCGGTVTTTAPTGIALTGGTIAVNSQCQFSVTVTGAVAGNYTNTTGNVTSTNGGTGNSASATLTVTAAPPTISKTFGALSIPLNGSTSLSFTIQNPNTGTTLNGIAFSDTLPPGLVISTPNGLTGSCGGGVITATQATSVISLSGASLAAGVSCTFSVNVTGLSAGVKTNTTGQITATNSPAGTTATATLKVEAPPSIAKVFNPSTIALNATTSLTFTITNPAANVDPLAGVAFTDTLPTGLTVANATATVCGGTLTVTAPTGIALTGATIAVNSQCQFSVTVTGAASGVYTNTSGNVSSTNGGTGNSATANLTVANAPTISKAFGAASILLNASTSLTFTINNPNTSLGLTGIAFTDLLPAGLQVATPNGLSSTCGGTTTAAAGSGSISLSGGTLAASASCTISLNVTGVAAGVQNNTSGPISSTESGAGLPSNTATITVIGPPAIAKAFGAASINLNATTTLTFTITNPNATVALTGVAFADNLPSGLAVANPNGLTGSCGAGTITTGTVSGISVVNLSGGTIAAGGSCTFSVNVVGQTSGHKVNTTGNVTSSNAGTGASATASIDVLAPDVTIAKTHSGTFNRGQTGAQYTITVSNVGFGPTVGTVTVVDTLPNVQNPPVPTALSGTGWTCTLATLTCTRSDALPSGSSYPPITLTVNIPSNIQNNFTNTATVSGGGDTNTGNNTATDPVSLGPPLTITPQSSITTTSTIRAGVTATFPFNVQNDDPATLGMVGFGCSGLPVGATCTFNPPATKQSTSVVTMSLTTSGGGNVISSHNVGDGPRFYAALLFPVLGLVGITFGARRRKTRIRLAVALAGVMAMLSFSGCGGFQGVKTPAGTYSVTVTAATTTVQASTKVTLTVVQ